MAAPTKLDINPPTVRTRYKVTNWAGYYRARPSGIKSAVYAPRQPIWTFRSRLAQMTEAL
jgi:hypothetical protein